MKLWRNGAAAWVALLVTIGSAHAAGALIWDNTHLKHSASAGETGHLYEFSLRNPGQESITIQEVKPSCGCTVAELPAQQWVIPPGQSDRLKIRMDFIGRHGKIVKSVEVQTTAGHQTLLVEAELPKQPAELEQEATRMRNQVLAQSDRQAVFKGDCASCHAEPTKGRKGWTLFVAACANCHQSEHRAAMVPDLSVASRGKDAEYWLNWIARGKEATLMPAFAREHGGPLDEEQVESLVGFLVRRYAGHPAEFKIPSVSGENKDSP